MTKNWLNAKGFLLDIYGVVYDGQGQEGGVAVDGSIEAIRLLRQAKIPFRFCSNQSTLTRETLCQRLSAAGLDIKPQEIHAVAPQTAKVNHLKRGDLRGTLLGSPWVAIFLLTISNLFSCFSY